MKLKYLFNKYTFLFLVLIVLPFRLNNVTKPLTSIAAFRQAQTATFALNFYKSGINLFQTELDIFGIGKERYLTLEFPLYEAIVAMLYKIFFVSDMWGRLVSIFAGLAGGWYLYRLIQLLFRNKTLALFSSFFYFFAPLNMFHQRDFLIEALVICFLLAGFYYFCHWVNYQDKVSYFLAITFLGVGFSQKGMYGPFWLLPLSWYYIKKFSFKSILSTKFIVLIALPLTLLFLWQKHINYINTTNGHEYFTSFSEGHWRWNIGTLADRFSIPLWQFRLKNILNGIFLKPSLLLFLLGLLAGQRIINGSFLYVWLLGQIIYFLIFFPIQSHIYYQMVIIPATALFTALGLVRVGNWVGALYRKLNIFKPFVWYIKAAFLAIFCAFFVWKSWLNSQWDAYTDWNWYKRLQQVGRSVPANTYGIFVNPGYDWNSVYTYYPKLKLKLVVVEEVTPENINSWKQSGYSYLVMHEYDKYPAYLKEVKPSHSLEFVKNYREVLSLEDFKVYLF